MQPLLNIGMRAARRAGDLIVKSLSRLDSLKIDSKGRNDFVSEVDRTAEREIIEIIHKHYPDHAILAEESGRSGETVTNPKQAIAIGLSEARKEGKKVPPPKS